MSDANVWSREPNGLINLRMTQAEWDELLQLLGLFGGVSAREGDVPVLSQVLRLVNRLNAGNPDFNPCDIAQVVSRLLGGPGGKAARS